MNYKWFIHYYTITIFCVFLHICIYQWVCAFICIYVAVYHLFISMWKTPYSISYKSGPQLLFFWQNIASSFMKDNIFGHSILLWQTLFQPFPYIVLLSPGHIASADNLTDNLMKPSHMTSCSSLVLSKFSFCLLLLTILF